MTEHQRILLELLQAVDAFCRRERMTYVMLGGTMLGAYRHRGFIPWDDDADIGMPREDYERFLRLASGSQGLPEPYQVRHFSLERRVPYAFAHVEHTETTCIEARRSGAGYVGGVYLEVFPLDEAAASLPRRRFRGWEVRLKKKLLYALVMERGKEGNHPAKRAGIALIRGLCTIDGRTRALDHALRKDARVRRRRAAASERLVGNLLGHWETRENLPEAVMFPPVEYSFEGCRLFGVHRPKEYLTALYGADFMTPPPPGEREEGRHEMSCCELWKPYRDYSVSVGKASR